MSVAELKQQAKKLGPADTLHLAAYLTHLARRKDPAYLIGPTTRCANSASCVARLLMG